MKYPTLLFGVLLSTLVASAQGGVVRPVPAWRAGDHRTLTTTVEMQLTVQDSLTVKANARCVQHVDVLSANKERYVVRFRLDPDSDMPSDLDMQMEGIPGAQAVLDSATARVKDLLAELQAPLRTMNFDFAISRAGATLELITGEKEEQRTKEVMTNMIGNMVRRLDGSDDPSQLDRAAHIVDSLFSAYKAVQVNNMDRLLEVYAYDFPSTGSERLPAVIEDVEAPFTGKFVALPGYLELGLDEVTEKSLTARIITTYDPDSLYAAMALETSSLQREGLLMTEESVHELDRRTGWMTTSSSVSTFRAKGLRMRLLERTVFKP